MGSDSEESHGNNARRKAEQQSQRMDDLVAKTIQTCLLLLIDLIGVLFGSDRHTSLTAIDRGDLGGEEDKGSTKNSSVRQCIVVASQTSPSHVMSCTCREVPIGGGGAKETSACRTWPIIALKMII